MNGRPVIVVAAGCRRPGRGPVLADLAAGRRRHEPHGHRHRHAEEQRLQRGVAAVPGRQAASFDVLAHADWTASFDIGSVAADGKGPGTLVMDVAASPSAARTPPVVSVFMNDVLLGAKEMEATGKRERIVAPIRAMRCRRAT